MTMYRRAIMPGSVKDFTSDDVTESGVPDTMVMCHACSRIIPSRLNLVNGTNCPFCHNNINDRLSNDILEDDSLFDEGEIIALSC